MYDIAMEVILCPEHKKLFEDRVKVKLTDGSKGIRPSVLNKLWMDSAHCVECNWKTTFDSE